MSGFSDNLSDPVRALGARGRGWRDLGAAVGLALLTVGVAVVYLTQPQTPRDLHDRALLSLAPSAYGPNLRAGERLLVRAGQARAAGADSLAEALEWRATESFARAAGAAGDSRRVLLANDRLAETFLAIGWRQLRRGRGRAFGLGRKPDALAVAERVAICVVGIAPTRRRAEIDAFVDEVEKVLDRAAAGSCGS